MHLSKCHFKLPPDTDFNTFREKMGFHVNLNDRTTKEPFGFSLDV